jgi:hypothetical protein
MCRSRAFLTARLAPLAKTWRTVASRQVSRQSRTVWRRGPADKPDDSWDIGAPRAVYPLLMPTALVKAPFRFLLLTVVSRVDRRLAQKSNCCCHPGAVPPIGNADRSSAIRIAPAASEAHAAWHRSTVHSRSEFVGRLPVPHISSAASRRAQSSGVGWPYCVKFITSDRPSFEHHQIFTRT